MSAPGLVPPTAEQGAPSTLRRRLANSNHPTLLHVRHLYRRLGSLYLPLPRPLLRAYRICYVVLRKAYNLLCRIFVSQPLFRAACARVGRGLRTEQFVHFVEGHGQLLIGDDVTVDGKCAFLFAQRFCNAPTLSIGDRSMIGHGCSFVVAREISIGTDCLLANFVLVFDSSGHSVDPDRRLAGLPPLPEDVKPVRIGNNVWIGTGATIFPGVTIGDGAVVAAQSVVVSNVAPRTLVAGYPARKLQDLAPVTESIAVGSV